MTADSEVRLENLSIRSVILLKYIPYKTQIPFLKWVLNIPLKYIVDERVDLY